MVVTLIYRRQLNHGGHSVVWRHKLLQLGTGGQDVLHVVQRQLDIVEVRIRISFLTMLIRRDRECHLVVLDAIEATVTVLDHGRHAARDRPVAAARRGQDVVAASAGPDEGRIGEDRRQFETILLCGHVQSEEVSVTT